MSLGVSELLKNDFERLNDQQKEIIKKFENTLKMLQIPVTVRVEKGFESSAACGQLRSSAQKRRNKS